MAQALISRAEAEIIDAHALISRAQAAAGVSAPALISRAEAATVGPASLGADQLGVEPWTTVTLTATASSGLPTSWAFTQLSGPAVTLTPSGNTVSFVTPASATTEIVSIQAVGTYADGSKTGAASVDIEVLFATEYMNLGGVWVPVQMLTFAPAP